MPTVVAEDKKNYENEIKAAQANATEVELELETTLAAVNAVYQKAYASKQEVVDGQAKIAEISESIIATELEMREREAIMAKQMRQVQLEGTQSDFITTIIASKNLSEMITHVTSLRAYRKMQNEKLVALDETKDELDKLKTQLQAQQTQLEKNQARYDDEYAELESKMATLKLQIAENQAQIVSLATAKAAEEKRLADETARLAALEIAEPKQPVLTKPVDKPLLVPEHETDDFDDNFLSSSNTMTVSTTGYSSDGLDAMTPGHITATGINLWLNPMCVAVDPTVISLGSMVEVPGYGIAIAGDTGGAIKGYKIDLHFKTTKQAIKWGRKTVTINVLG
ncbi:hypothetical protein Hs30E_09090 [Lactococcus hodotermopsidis]|uniref:3D domain-containing protein n=2 Tax=Pseudolactococcus hodotermopsidis TaxID=2709157 RepID=A0A6A0BDD8_9LACT|nr:hypothetical protein Hs30E_09090 [Lactococcus hodotermopsidis]